MDKYVAPIIALLTAILGVALVAALMSKNAQTSQVIGAAGSAFNTILGTALSPITGGGGFTNNSALSSSSFDTSQILQGAALASAFL